MNYDPIRMLLREIHQAYEERRVWTADYRTAERVRRAGPRRDVASVQKDVDANVRGWDLPSAVQAPWTNLVG